MTTEASAPPFGLLLQMIGGFQVTQMIYVAARLGIADLVADGSRTSSDLAQATGTDEQALYRLLRTLASLGIFAEDEQHRFGLTPLAQLLQTNVPGSLRSWAIWHGESVNWNAWGSLLYSIRTGKSAVPQVFGMTEWEYLAQHPDLNTVYNNMFTGFTVPENDAVANSYDFLPFGTLVDVAGGQGSLIATILKANPTLHGILFDQPHVVPSAQPVLAGAGVAERCELVGGDFFVALPSGGDAYILKYILHDWDDNDALRILKNCRQVMKPDGKLLIVDFIIPPGNAPDTGKLLDIMMLVMLGGQERTEAEFRTLLANAGFAVTKILSTATQMSVIEAVPI